MVDALTNHEISQRVLEQLREWPDRVLEPHLIIAMLRMAYSEDMLPPDTMLLPLVNRTIEAVRREWMVGGEVAHAQVNDGILEAREGLKRLKKRWLRRWFEQLVLERRPFPTYKAVKHRAEQIFGSGVSQSWITRARKQAQETDPPRPIPPTVRTLQTGMDIYREISARLGHPPEVTSLAEFGLRVRDGEIPGALKKVEDGVPVWVFTRHGIETAVRREIDKRAREESTMSYPEFCQKVRAYAIRHPERLLDLVDFEESVRDEVPLPDEVSHMDLSKLIQQTVSELRGEWVEVTKQPHKRRGDNDALRKLKRKVTLDIYQRDLEKGQTLMGYREVRALTREIFGTPVRNEDIKEIRDSLTQKKENQGEAPDGYVRGLGRALAICQEYSKEKGHTLGGDSVGWLSSILRDGAIEGAYQGEGPNQTQCWFVPVEGIHRWVDEASTEPDTPEEKPEPLTWQEAFTRYQDLCKEAGVEPVFRAKRAIGHALRAGEFPGAEIAKRPGVRGPGSWCVPEEAVQAFFDARHNTETVQAEPEPPNEPQEEEVVEDTTLQAEVERLQEENRKLRLEKETLEVGQRRLTQEKEEVEKRLAKQILEEGDLHDKLKQEQAATIADLDKKLLVAEEDLHKAEARVAELLAELKRLGPIDEQAKAVAVLLRSGMNIQVTVKN